MAGPLLQGSNQRSCCSDTRQRAKRQHSHSHVIKLVNAGTSHARPPQFEHNGCVLKARSRLCQVQPARSFLRPFRDRPNRRHTMTDVPLTHCTSAVGLLEAPRFQSRGWWCLASMNAKRQKKMNAQGCKPRTLVHSRMTFYI